MRAEKRCARRARPGAMQRHTRANGDEIILPDITYLSKRKSRPGLRQLVALRLFGYRGLEPKTRREASELIQRYLDQKGGRHG